MRSEPNVLLNWLRAALVLIALPLAAVIALAIAGAIDWHAAGWVAGALVLVLGAIAYRHVEQLARLERLIARGEVPAADRLTALDRRLARLLLPGLVEALGQNAEDRRAAHAELEAAMSGNAAALAVLPDPLIMLDRRRRVVRANAAARELLEAEPEGQDLTSMLRAPVLIEAVDGILAGEDRREVEFIVPGSLQRDFQARLARLPGPAADGTVAVLALHDITAIRRAEQLRADFVANASHELRTPLTSLLGFLETLRGPARGDKAAEKRFVEIMHEQATRMARLIEDLLSLSRIEMDEHSPPSGRTDLKALLESVAAGSEPQARERSMSIALDAAAGRAAIGDRDELAQVFQNLIDNAIKYGRAGTRVDVFTETGPEVDARLGRLAVKISVRDRGEGIARRHLPRLTERFYRVDPARSRALGGTGLGLAIVKHIVNRHRGLLEIDSEEGEGSTFSVYLPAVGEDRSGEASPTAAQGDRV